MSQSSGNGAYAYSRIMDIQINTVEGPWNRPESRRNLLPIDSNGFKETDMRSLVYKSNLLQRLAVLW